ncbi:PspC domain-containing protein [Mucilaginibacter sp. UR6-1]|uniref:PspC domain-containing protein n=1 Tax=Mucilaginibacter sp. UR6-1 TaxID=1435643 RepID=UPI001E446E65|nr:PspC domain-containing protein [Mucilaginibacter sp. UR6-1]MCC8409631.1 PspC domain-containing protein [Mucilaginibacter sp. UR6-1]
MEKKLYRDELRKKVGGVCAGLADYFGVDVSIIRVIFLVTFIVKGFGGLIYVILWIVLPKRNVYFDPNVGYTVPPPQEPYNPFKSSSEPNFTMPNYEAGKPFGSVPPVKKTSSVGVIMGAILIIIGGAFLLDEFNLIPDVDFDVLWPLLLVGAGIAFILSGAKSQPWERKDWNQPAPEQPAATEPEKKEEQTFNDNPPTV